MPELVHVRDHVTLTEPTPLDIQRIEQWSGEGYALIELARGLDISKDTLNRWRKDHQAVADALEAGRACEHKKLLSKLVEKALAGDTIALLFLLKTRHGYREGAEPDTGPRVHIKFELPAALPIERMTIEAKP